MPERKRTRKRRESFGQIETLPSGNIRARYTAPNGERVTAPRTFTTATDARGWLAVQRAAIVSGEWSADLVQTRAGRGESLGVFAADWLTTRTNRHGEGLRPRTRAEYQRLIDGPLADLAARRIADLTPSLVRGWYADMIASGRKTTAARAYGLLRAILATAVSDGRLKSNPCVVRGAMSASTGRRVEPPTPAELATIVATITPRYRALVLVAAWGGLRFGELTELRRKDLTVTLDGREVDGIVVSVSRAVTHTGGGIGYVIGEPKSAAGVRAIALPPHIVPDVVEHLRKFTGDFPESLLFPAADGATHLAQSTLAKAWYPARDAAGRPDLPFHALRHYGATRYALTGATLRELQARLGHSTAAAAMRYQHEAGRDAELAARMSDLA